MLVVIVVIVAKIKGESFRSALRAVRVTFS
jgi:hypothetical protein